MRSFLKMFDLASAFLFIIVAVSCLGQNLPASEPQQQNAPTIQLGLRPKSSAPVAEKPATKSSEVEVEVSGGQPWVDTKIDLMPGERVSITATGTVQFQMQSPTGPEGQPRAWMDLLRALPLNSAGRGALLGKIGAGDIAAPFLLGAKF